MVAAVDLARVRKPLHAEGGHAEEETIQSDLKQQMMMATTEQQVTVKTEAVHIPMIPPMAIQTTTDDQSIHVTQVCYLFIMKRCLLPSFLRKLNIQCPACYSNFCIEFIVLTLSHSVGYFRYEEVQKLLSPTWMLPLRHPQFHISQFQKLLFLNLTLAMR